MLVRVLSSFATSTGAYHAGEEIDIPSGLAARLIDRGCAVPVRREPVETAVRIAPEKAVRRRGKRNVEPS